MGNTEAAERLTGSLQRLATNGVVSFDEPLWKITDASSATRNLPWPQPVQMPLPPAFPVPALPLCVSWTSPPAWRMISTTAPMPPCRRPIPFAARAPMIVTTCRCNPARHACVVKVPGWGLRGDYSGASALWMGAPPAQAVQVVMQSKLEHRGAVNLTLPGKFFQPIEKRLRASEGYHMKSGHASQYAHSSTCLQVVLGARHLTTFPPPTPVSQKSTCGWPRDSARRR